GGTGERDNDEPTPFYLLRSLVHFLDLLAKGKERGRRMCPPAVYDEVFIKIGIRLERPAETVLLSPLWQYGRSGT
ncbi:MAG: hypothetical protein ACK4VP_07155, partial [Nitrospira sp.]